MKTDKRHITGRANEVDAIGGIWDTCLKIIKKAILKTVYEF